MITKEQKFRLGIFLFVSVFLLLVILAIFLLPKLSSEGDNYYIKFKDMSVNGLNEGSDVKYQGVRIGKVSRMMVDPKDLNTIRVDVTLRRGFPVKKNMRSKLQYAGITGLRFVEIFSTDAGPPDSLNPGSEIPVGGKDLVEQAEDIAVNVNNVVKALEDLLKAENRENISKLLAHFEKSSGVLSRLLTRKEKNLQEFFANIDRAAADLGRIAKDFNEISERINQFTREMRFKKLAENSNKMVRNISERFSAEEFGKVLENFDTFVKTTTSSLKKVEGSVGEMEVELKKTLVSLRESMENIAKFTRDLREDPTMLIRKRGAKRRKK
jgi:ABC-type transporter Mla subunit MlaD